MRTIKLAMYVIGPGRPGRVTGARGDAVEHAELAVDLGDDRMSERL